MTDLSPDELRRMGGAAVERLARYLETLESRPVLARTKPGEVLAKLPPRAPERPEEWDAIERDLDALIEPNMTHWQHPGYLAYFANTGAVPGVVGDILAAGYNQIGILWRTSPILTELEMAVVRWLADLVGLPSEFDGQLADFASTGSLIALAAAREQAFPDVRKTGLAALPAGVVYSSEMAHSSIDKACVVLGLGTEGLRKIPVDERFAMRADALAAAIADDRAKGRRPVAVVATVGTTTVASADPVAKIADVCEREEVWLHVDAAYAGSAASVPELRPLFAGWERADSLLFNPHKWMFVPVECTALLFRRMERVRRAFSVVPHYLETPEGSAGVREYMDYGIQLGRRFRALKMWITLRMFGAEGVRARIREHVAMAKELAETLAKEPDVELLAPVLFSLVVFRFAPNGLSPAEADAANRRILEAINAEGTSFISHAVLSGRYVLRLAIGNIRTERRHLEAFLASFRREAQRERAETLAARAS
ncbi:MAG TPA: aminotransferase class I/II-fold pyridoxal phosphate-dependent enzyme [Thermoanaerobaculia bacterium]|nr:aminotransferase class I/II-fold pyridoxal phosphate-dependent enzyme [Thermoanaerobaculia bacterium]